MKKESRKGVATAVGPVAGLPSLQSGRRGRWDGEDCEDYDGRWKPAQRPGQSELTFGKDEVGASLDSFPACSLDAGLDAGCWMLARWTLAAGWLPLLDWEAAISFLRQVPAKSRPNRPSAV